MTKQQISPPRHTVASDLEVHQAQHDRFQARHLVVIVTCALIYGALVYVSRFSPQVAGIQSVYPPAAVAAPFGVWFGTWGGVGNALGNLVSAVLVGRSPLPWLLAYVGQFVMAVIPAILYRKGQIATLSDLIRFELANAIGLVIGSILVAVQLQLNGTAPANVVWTVIWPTMIVSSLTSGLVLAPLIMKYVGPYVIRSGMIVNSRLK